MTTTTIAREAAPQAATLQMIRAEINVREFHRWMGIRRLQDPDHAMHCLLTECFGKPPHEGDGLAPKPFRLILPRDCPQGTLYGYGKANAEELRDAAQLYGDPAQCQILNLPTLAAKSMPTEWTAGKLLGFEIRIRPIVRLRKDLDRVPPERLRLFRQTGRSGDREGVPRPGAECDVFQWEALLHPKGEMGRSREQVYRDWLASRFTQQGGAELESATLQSFQRVRSYRKRQTRQYVDSIEGPDAVMQGNLTITDSADFAQLLDRGIGRHRAYGYGMLLLRQPRR